MLSLARRIRLTGALCVAVLLCACVFEPPAVASESTEPVPRTLEDLFGDTGNTFQASVGLSNLEGQSGNPAGRGFGLAVDDMFVEWFEFEKLVDTTDCSTGACAVLDVPSGTIWEGVTSIPISLQDESPYGRMCQGGANKGLVCFAVNGNADCPSSSCVLAKNDCDWDGFFDGSGDDNDCNDNGIEDVVVLATSAVDFGEIVVLDRVSPTTYEYRGDLTVSVLADNDGVLFLEQSGDEDPDFNVTYLDYDDGTGQICQNDIVPENRGRVQTGVAVNIQTCDVSVVGQAFTDNGDEDLFPDSQETIELVIDVQNNCGYLLTNCVARLFTNSPEVECIKKGTVVLGDLPGNPGGAGPIITSSEGFIFKMDDLLADRTNLGLGIDDALSASFDVAISCTEIDGLTFPQSFSLSLDLNINDAGQTSFEWTEGFEAGGTNPTSPLQGTAFVHDNLDIGLPGNNNAEGLINADGWRCQFSDPDWVNSNSYGDAEGQVCYPAMNLAHAAATWWQIDGSLIAGSPDGGRAFKQAKSMYYGVFLGDPQENFTTPLSTVSGVKTDEILNLGVWYPELTFWQQVSLADHRAFNTVPGFLNNMDRGVVQVKQFDAAGADIGVWMNLQPLQNTYVEQSADNYWNCLFDPIDDGNTEDTFFDPTDPERDHGPSSTCNPEFTWAWQGSTTGDFVVDNVGHATTPPASTDIPNWGLGTWVEAKVDLSEFRGRRVKLRYLVTSIKVTSETHFAQWGAGINEREDGWWLDEIAISEVLTDPATFEVDDYTMGHCSTSGASCINQCKFSLISCTNDAQCGVNEPCLRACPVGQTCLPGPVDCGPVCTSVTANAFITPDEELNPGTVDTPVPGQAVTINGAAPADPITGALPSTSDACLSGNLQYRFCRDGDPLGEGTNPADGDCDDAWDVILRGWTENAVITVAPQATAGYTMEVRCSTATSCKSSELVQIDVTCPGAENALGLKALRFPDPDTMEWSGAPLIVDIWTSDAYTLMSDLAAYSGTREQPAMAINTKDISGVNPDPDEAYAFLVKADGPLNTIQVGFYCNSVTWRSGGAAEIPFTTPYPGGTDRDGTIGP